MTRNDFEIIAEVLRAQRPDLPTDDMTDYGLDQVAQAFADRLKLVNPRFDRARFLRASGVEV